ncbi:hypothetical protein AJ79_03822 [Helicocarpus griseus UAMH5409]|uniref:Uncharacterized protein n=1 Tax=Helicocarpus griseus UAMH5409 TaxID=1447875 RepID=A0A2B7XVY6_9EURO|nr:hypothetical protein AJ79_03822 [Helicocarpus griseus UAMH5409]
MFKCGVSTRQWTVVADSAVTKWNQGATAIGSARSFSSSSSIAAENDGSLKDRQSLRDSARRQIDQAFSQSSSSSKPLIRRIALDSPAPRQQFQQRPHQQQQQQRRPLDARALGSKLKPADGQPANILRAPANLRRPNLRAGGAAPPKRGTGPPRRKRQDKSARKDNNEGGWAGPREMTKEEREADEKAFLEQWERERPKPVRYNPHGYNVENLQRTWPALPMGEMGPKEALHERLAWMSERYPNGFEPTDLLAQRVYKGEWTYFYNEEEKKEAIEMAQKMAKEKAEKLTDRKGAVIEPEDMSFQPMDDAQKKQLISRLISGEYKSEQTEFAKQHSARHPVMKDVLRYLENNGTWQTSHKTKFLEALSKSLPQPKVARPKVNA